MRRVASATVGIFLLLIMLAPHDLASASSFLNLYVPSGSCSQFGIFEGINVTVQSNVPYPVTEIIFGVFRNNIGQPLEVAASALTMNPYQNQTGFLIFNLPQETTQPMSLYWHLRGFLFP